MCGYKLISSFVADRYEVIYIKFMINKEEKTGWHMLNYIQAERHKADGSNEVTLSI